MLKGYYFCLRFFHFRSNSLGTCGGMRVELMLYTVLILPSDDVVVVFVFFGFDFWRRTVIAASSNADLTSAIQYSFAMEVPEASSLKFSAVSR